MDDTAGDHRGPKRRAPRAERGQADDEAAGPQLPGDPEPQGEGDHRAPVWVPRRGAQDTSCDRRHVWAVKGEDPAGAEQSTGQAEEERIGTWV